MKARNIVTLSILVLAGGLIAPAAQAVSVPADFVVENAIPAATLTTPTVLAFLPDGRWLVGEKRGRIYVVTNGVLNPTPMLNINREVLNANDRGLLGLAVDPNFATNRYIYLLYTVDPDSNDVETDDDAFGRLTRFQVSASNPDLVDPASRTVLIGPTWRTGIPSGSPSHTIGTLTFGADGSLLVSAGDGGQFNVMDDGGHDDGLFGATRTDPAEDIGAFRAQYLSSLAGKILRVDPATGGGYPSNPFWDGNPSSNRSRVWAYGLRNPFRFTVRPGTGNPDPAAGNPGVLYLGDVGRATFEEQNVATQGGRNFGWPCYEGVGLSSDFPNANPAHHGCSSIGTPDNPSTPTPPYISTNHSNPNVSTPVGLTGNTAVGGAWYMGTLYPSTYRQRYFFADYGQNWIKVATMSGTDQLVSVANFATAADGPVCMQTDPQTGDLLYVAIEVNQVRRIRYTGAAGNGNPVADARATPDIGVAPLSVQFTGSGSFDPDGDPLAWSWNFGDGSGATVANPTHVYNIANAYDVVLTVTDGKGGVGRDTVRVTVASNNDFPTTAVLDNFNRANGPIGGSWVGLLAGLNIDNNAITPTTGYVSPVWNGAIFGVDQEAFVTLATPGTVPEQDLMLKIQGTSWDNGHIEVRYDAIAGVVKVNTYTPSVGWVMATSLPATFVAGDVLGARAWSNGAVEIFRNGIRLGSTSVAGWAFAGNGGRIGLTIAGPSGARLDNFGGGDVVLNSNTRPDGTILSPAPGSFFFAGQSITLDASATDSQDPPASLTYRWEVDVHHNNHDHPNSHTYDTRTATLVGENHDDGTGVFYRVRLIVTDTGGLKDTSAVDIYPEIDLTPSAVVTTPASPTDAAPADYVFKLYNRGRMPAPVSRWMLRAGGTLMAQGDTLVAANDSVVVTRRLGPLAAGGYALRVVVDTLAAVVENNEANNAVTRTLTVIGAPDLTPPSFVTGPAVTPSVTSALAQWTTNEPARGAVRYGFGATPTDSVLTALGTTHAATLAGLARATSYTYRVAISDGAGNTTVSAPASFTTLANRPPAIGSASATPLSGGAPLTVQFTAGATDPDGDTPTYAWAFGDGQNGGGPSLSHVYAAGTYTATLTVSDGFGGSATATFTITATPGGFPTTGVLDDFNRPNGAIGGSWIDETTNLVITSNQLAMNASGWRSPVWNGAIFGPDQEAYIRLSAITATSPEHDLMLKVQGTTHSGGHIEVRYDAQAKKISVNTHAPSQGWVARGSITNLTLVAGDVLGARALGNGNVEVFRNGVKLGTYSVAGWPFAAGGGRVGLTLANATSSRLDDFGGGNVVTNTKPTASITAPANNAFYYPSQSVTLTGSANDAQDAPAALGYRWEVELNAGGAVVSTTVFTTASAGFTAQSAAGANPFYTVRLIVTDSGGLKDTVAVRLNPEIDLEPSVVTVTPDPPADDAAATYRFAIANRGRVAAGLSSWVLRAGNVQLAQGDAAVPALDSVVVTRSIGPLLAIGSYTLRVTADSLAAITETDETDNARVRTLAVIDGTPPPNTPPQATLGSPANGSPFVTGQSVPLVGSGSDAEDASASLGLHWEVDRIDAAGTTANVFAFDGPSAALIPQSGDPIAYVIRLIVTDLEGLRDTAQVRIDAEVDLEPSVVTVTPAPTDAAPAEFRFAVVNRGRMAAPPSRWVLRDGAALLAQGDAAVPALDSVVVTRTLGPLTVGSHVLRIVVDSLAAVRETDETNDARTRTLTVTDGSPPAFVTSVTITPGKTSMRFQWGTSEPARGAFRWGTTEALGDSVTTPLATAHDVTLGGLVAETVYHAQIAITDAAGNTTLSDPFPFGTLANRPPVAAAAPTPATGTAPLSVNFSSVGSSDPDGDPLTYAWSFGNGQTSTLANPTTVYSAPGTFTATLTVRDPSLASATATTTVVVSAPPSFPVTAVLDNFNRANGTIGGSWVDEISNLTIASNQMRPTTSSPRSTVWNGATFGPNQEAFVTLAAITSNSPEHDLMLKVQGASWSAGHIEVRYDHVVKRVTVNTYAPAQGWVARGSLTITLVSGDRFGARALASGNLEVYRNGSKLATYSIAGWPFNAQGGRLGLTLDKAGSSRLDDFGGGTLPMGLTLAAAGGCVDAPSDPESPHDTLSAAGAIDVGPQSARTTDLETQRDAPWTTPAKVAVSAAYPNPSGGGVSMALELPRIARVTWTILDLQGRVMSRGERATNAGRPIIHWSGTHDAGGRAGAGLYLARVTVDRETFTRRIVLLK